MDLNLIGSLDDNSKFSREFLEGQYAGYGLMLEVMRWRLAGVSGDPNETTEWAKTFSERMT